eukprot:4058017-Alexandrium_andersonii.AAC.1
MPLSWPHKTCMHLQVAAGKERVGAAMAPQSSHDQDPNIQNGAARRGVPTKARGSWQLKALALNTSTWRSCSCI